ncbi:hypothetical protein AX774_g7007 [Zancudomyces culisetae]|uniref:Uncharacterized protein n=1 Tax=Zancudomyces culisetae TaxID=1213189 RepID=A0A1R1PF21_ZANCU|nr:hypothetical protein AX774_g7007 [Zancudomyces culisetae]|eukprot:OMH79574.1 hypothetical protein AX774_g7007 [Zancudomyces culisetae]
MGRKHVRDRVSAYDCIIDGLIFNIRGYISNGDNVPDVMTTVENRRVTGCIQIAASKHTSRNIGLGTVAVSDSYGSSNTVNPSSYVAHNVPNAATCCNPQ